MLEEVESKKHVKFDDLNAIVNRCVTKFGHLFPRYTLTANGSRFVHHFNVAGLSPISLEKEHGSREYVPKTYVKLAVSGIKDLIAYIEAHHEEGPELLPKPEISD